MSVIKPLPSWAIINRFPSFYDGESLTAIEQTARLYGKVNELIETYNRYVTTINGDLTELETQVQKDLACAVRTIINLTDSYITQVELRLGHQDRKLDEAYKAFTEDITSEVDAIIRQMKDAGELDQVILDAVDNLNTKFDTYTSGVEDEQVALRADYEATKQALFAEYESFIAGIDSEYQHKQTELTNTVDNFLFAKADEVSANTGFRENTSKTIYAANGEGFVGQSIPAIADYSLVGVLTAFNRYAICKVFKNATGAYTIKGVGVNSVSFDAVSSLVDATVVQVTLTPECVVSDSKAGALWVGSESNTITDLQGIVRIDGLVLNSGNIS